ncbi:MAG: hypothetical protein OEW06_06835 [Gemmatimonadota bacterium]|nr:hypothetical protein [Gemmatimonadota bacterium]
MRYFHRTPVPIDDVLAAADTFFGERMQTVTSKGRHRTYRHTAGTVTVDLRVEGGHYTHVTVATDQVGESEVDKLAKRFLGTVHTKAHAAHELRGAY